jgi:hypothetical protein
MKTLNRAADGRNALPKALCEPAPSSLGKSLADADSQANAAKPLTDAEFPRSTDSL